MPKRSAEEKIQYYNDQIKKLRLRNQRRRRVIVYSSSSDSEENSDIGAQDDQHVAEPPPSPPDAAAAPRIDVEAAAAPPDAGAGADASPDPDADAAAADMPMPELDAELLEALGDPSNDHPAYGAEIHEKLAQRWLPLLRKGMEMEAKQKLLKEYNFPANCKLLKAPILNAELSAAVSDLVRSRDKKLQEKQNQLGLGITAINRAMNLLLTGEDKVQAVKILSDGCRILTDLHYVETQVRTKLLTPGLDKSFLSLVQDQERDETLFGSLLADKIKASKAIEKRGLQIKKVSNPRATTTSGTSTGSRHQQQQGNWMGPPRSSWSSRGGHTPHARPPPPPPAPRPPRRAPPRACSSTAGPANRRAPTRH